MQFILLGVRLKGLETRSRSSNPIEFWKAQTLTTNSQGRMFPAPNAAAVVFPFCIMAIIVPQLDICLKFKSIQGENTVLYSK